MERSHKLFTPMLSEQRDKILLEERAFMEIQCRRQQYHVVTSRSVVVGL